MNKKRKGMTSGTNVRPKPNNIFKENLTWPFSFVLRLSCAYFPAILLKVMKNNDNQRK